jgi:hypothetical protein
MSLRVACVVEGHGEVAAVPNLLRRLAFEILPNEPFIVAGPPIRIFRLSLVKPGELETAVELAARKTWGQGATLVLIDSDTDCPGELGPRLLARAVAVRPTVPVSVVLCKREFESWFLAAARSLRGCRGLPMDLEPPGDPEAVNDAKGWLAQRMPRGRSYSPRPDQPKFAAIFDLAQARAADSFDKCYREVQRLLTILHSRQRGASTP